MADTMTATTESMIDFGHQNVEALMRASQIWTAGLQTIGGQIAATATSQMEQAMGTIRQMSSVKSVKDAVELQASLVRSAVEAMVAHSSKLSDASVKLAEQTMQPITARVTAATSAFRPQV